ncbi:MAG: GNAT family N-acetyltransferase, partial [Anaerolineae bacterium]
MLVDMGARGKGQPCHPRVAVEGEGIVGYGALDFSPAMRQAQLVGPVVHPEHRRRGHGRALL